MVRSLALMMIVLAGSAPEFTPFYDNMSEARVYHASALLQDGRVLVSGGREMNGKGMASSEIFDPKKSSWEKTGEMTAGRWGHSITVLKDGRVVSAGSKGGCDLFDPKSGKWEATGALNTLRYNHTATLLDDGRVLVAGGLTITGKATGQKPLTSAEVYDPKTGKWSAAGEMAKPRYNHTATLLKDGRVLVAGGLNNSNLDAPPYAECEIYDPKNDSWQKTGSLKKARLWHADALLKDGRVLVIGGYNSGKVQSCEIFDPASGKWSKADDLKEARYDLTSTTLPDGRVVVAAGATGDSTPSLTSTEIFDPDKGTWSTGPSIKTARRTHTIWPIGPDQVLVIGGWSRWGGKLLSSTEVVKLEK